MILLHSKLVVRDTTKRERLMILAMKVTNHNKFLINKLIREEELLKMINRKRV